jgi:streptogramin lyase
LGRRSVGRRTETAASAPSASSTPAPSTAPPRGALAQIDAIEPAGAARIDGIGRPDWLILSAGSAWVAGDGDGVGRLDGRAAKLAGSIAVPGEVCLAMDVGFESIWVGSCGTPSVTRIDPETAQVVATVRVPVDDLLEESSVAAGEQDVWVLSRSSGKLVKIDPKVNKVAATFAQPAGAGAIRAAFGALWVTVPDRNTLLRLDPTTGATVAEVTVGGGPRFLAVGEGGVWVLNQADGSVTRVDPATNTVVATVVVSGMAVTAAISRPEAARSGRGSATRSWRRSTLRPTR